MISPYHIVGPASIGFSGGRTSGKMLYEILKEFEGTLPDDLKVCFNNTGKECEETLEFVEEVSLRWNVPVVWLEYDDVFDVQEYWSAKKGILVERRVKGSMRFKIVDFKTASRRGEPFDKMLLYYEKYRAAIKGKPPVLPNPAQRMCTANLKIKLTRNYMRSLGYSDFALISGIRHDEPKRFSHMMRANETRSDGFEYELPLYTAGVTKEDVNRFWREQPFDLRLDALSYEGNCRYCFLKNTDKIVGLMRKNIVANGGQIPDDLQWWIDKEQHSGMVFRRDRPNVAGLVQIAMSTEEIVAVDEPIIDCMCGEPND